MKAYMISLDHERERPAGVGLWPATPDWRADQEMKILGLRWTYPWDQEEIREGMRLRPYKTANRLARMGCFLSHFTLWQACARADDPVLILEDDAVPLRPLEALPDMGPFGAVSINDPRGATRKALQYNAWLQISAVQRVGVAVAPWVDAEDIPQGLPGHSAYMIQPWFAQRMTDKAREVGAWPNDALMNKQFFPGLLGCSTTYYTRVSGRASTLA